MITEDYVSFETAKLLKEKGFNEFCNNAYIDENRIVYRFSNNDEQTAICTAPTLQMAMKWLREVHNIKVNVFYNNPNYAIEYFELNTQTGVNESVFIGDGYDVYEQACEVAIKYCLENLI